MVDSRHPNKIIIQRRCDVPMRRSKERNGTNQFGFRMKWKCNGDCKTCICCIEKDDMGQETHVNLLSRARKRDEL